MNTFLQNLCNLFVDTPIKMPLFPKMLLRSLFSNVAVKNNRTIRFNKIEYNIEISPEDIKFVENKLLIQNKHFILPKNILSVYDNAVTFTFGWSNIAKKPNSIFNKKLNDYMSALLGAQLKYIIYSMPNIAPEQATLCIVFILNTLQHPASPIYSNNATIGTFSVSCQQTNSLNSVSGYCEIKIQINF